jgi:hypothetical protein
LVFASCSPDGQLRSISTALDNGLEWLRARRRRRRVELADAELSTSE